MSKAFLRESDFDVPEELLARAAPMLSAGGRMSFTPEGAARLQEELRELTEVERPKIAGGSALNVDERTALQVLDRRIHLLVDNLRMAEIVPAPDVPDDTVRFGAYVTVRDGKKLKSRYRIVGAAETELEPEWISGESPLGRALLNRRKGEHVVFDAPRGEIALEIVDVEYVRVVGF